MEFLLLAAVVTCICAFLQCIIGFGYSLMVIPLLLLANRPLPEVVTLVVVSAIAMRLYAIHSLRNHIDWKQLKPVIWISFLGIPVGIWLLHSASSLSQDTVRQGVGTMILLMLLLRFAFRIQPRENLPVSYGMFAGFTSGILNGLANIGGPPIVLWIQAKKMNNQATRITLMAFSIFHLPVQIVLLYIAFGPRSLAWMQTGLILWLAVLPGSWIGIKVGNRLPLPFLQKLISIALGIMGISYIVRPLF